MLAKYTQSFSTVGFFADLNCPRKTERKEKKPKTLISYLFEAPRLMSRNWQPVREYGLSTLMDTGGRMRSMVLGSFDYTSLLNISSRE